MKKPGSCEPGFLLGVSARFLGRGKGKLLRAEDTVQWPPLPLPFFLDENASSQKS